MPGLAAPGLGVTVDVAAGSRQVAPVSVYINARIPDRAYHLFGAFLGLLANHQLLNTARLAHHRLFMPLDDLIITVLELSGPSGTLTRCLPPLHDITIVAEADVLLDWLLHHVRSNSVAVLGRTLTYVELLPFDRYDLLIRTTEPAVFGIFSGPRSLPASNGLRRNRRVFLVLQVQSTCRYELFRNPDVIVVFRNKNRNGRTAAGKIVPIPLAVAPWATSNE